MERPHGTSAAENALCACQATATVLHACAGKEMATRSSQEVWAVLNDVMPQCVPLSVVTGFLLPSCRTTIPSGTGRNHPCRAKLDAGMAPVLRLDDAQTSNPTVQPQRRRNRSPDLSVHGNRLGPAINSASELALAPAQLHHITRPRLASGRASKGSSSSTPATSIRLGLRQHSRWELLHLPALARSLMPPLGD